METIGIFDSGTGCLTLLKSILSCGAQRFVYVADTAYLPYGSQPPEVIIERTHKIVTFMVAQGISKIVVACHTSAALALETMRRDFPHITFIDVLPLTVEVACALTRNNRIGVMATPANIESHRHKKLLLKRNPQLYIIEQACQTLAHLIETEFGSENLKHALESYTKSLQLHDVDTVVLGCTHYAYVAHEIQTHLPNASLVSADKEIVHVLPKQHAAADPIIEVYTTGPSEHVER